MIDYKEMKRKQEVYQEVCKWAAKNPEKNLKMVTYHKMAWYSWVEWSIKMIETFIKVCDIVTPYGFRVDMVYDFADTIHESPTGEAQLQLLLPDQHNIQLGLWKESGLISVEEYLDNGDIITHAYKNTFTNAAKYAIKLFKAHKFQPNYGTTN